MDQPPATAISSIPSLPTCELLGMTLARTDETGLLDHMFGGLARGAGGWVVTANLDFLRRYVKHPEMRSLYGAADIAVADGMPLVWAARLQGDQLPERVAGSALVWSLAERAAREGRSIYLLGGEPRANEEAVGVLRGRWPALTVVGHSSPTVASPPTPAQLAPLRDELVRLAPDLILVGMGSPKQEQLIQALRPYLPKAWMMGVGISFSFVSGRVRRAPVWMQKSGLEWVWRLSQEPRRLARRYLVEDLPFSVELFARALWRRVRARG
jgi:N-acetylglucosaminyldiphosphoundecaprenol N-acetyl-beta-D-mannosaminyltransferase